MDFKRIENPHPLNKQEKVRLLEDYIVHYKSLIAKNGLDALRRIPGTIPISTIPA